MIRESVPQSRSRRSRRSAFTLLEMMLVIALIGVLLGVVVLKFGAFWTQGTRGAAQVFIDGTAKTALSGYRFAVGGYPTTAQGLGALVVAPEGVGSRWAGPYLDVKGGKVPDDPWGRPYKYVFPGTKNPGGYDLYSVGEDGQEGTADDVTNW